MMRLLTRSQLKSTKQAASRLLTCVVAISTALALSLPVTGISAPLTASAFEGGMATSHERALVEDVIAIASDIADMAQDNQDTSSNNDTDPAASNPKNPGYSAPARSAYVAEENPGSSSNYSYDEPMTPAGEQIAPAAVDTSDPRELTVLEANRFTGINPEDTTVNLYDYTSYKDASGNDQMYDPSNADAWLGNEGDPNINTGHALTFGNGMSTDMGYWNAGSGSANGGFPALNPGFQNIVGPTLTDDGYPQLSTDSMVVEGEGVTSAVNNEGVEESCDAWPSVGGYDSNPPLYDNYPKLDAAGDKNVSDKVQGQWDKDTSLGYLFDTSDEAQAAPGRTETHTDVKGLFQLDDQGYYYYNMRENFAEYTSSPVEGRDGTIPGNSFILYDAPAGLRTDGTGSVGNFFPFNTGEQVFKVDGDRLVSDVYANNGATNGHWIPANTNLKDGKPFINHNLGMSMDTSFRQPIGGKVGAADMTFEFIGDDDLWIFIDGVLVLDLGGIHSELYGTINFATGEVKMGTAFDTNGEIKNAPVRTTTIREMFRSAGREDDLRWNGNTFASSTSHTLKMFYFERGNFDSSLSLRFNLQPALYQQIKKVDQNGNPLEGAEFDLYEVNVPAGTNADNAANVTLDQVSVKGAPIVHVVTDRNGEAKFVDPASGKGDPFNFSDRYDGASAGLLYILRETKAPIGYKPVPTDILLRFNPANTMLIVNNRYQTGSYASFNSYVTGNTGSVYYGQIGENGEPVSKIPDDQLGGAASAHVPIDVQRYGLVVAVPMLKEERYNSDRAWFPLYGDNLVGFKTVHVGDLDAAYDQYKQDTRVSTLMAALMQAGEHYRSEQGLDAQHTEGWYLDWDTDTGRLVGTLHNLPGRADRYLLTNPDGDMRMYYSIIEPEALARVLGVSEAQVRAMSAAQRYEALGAKAMEAIDADGGAPGTGIDELVRAIDPYPTSFESRGYTPLDISEFIRNFRTVLYIPNEQRQLRVMKIDQNGTALNGAEFSLYASEDDARNDRNRVAFGRTSTVDGADGMLVFEPRQSHGAAQAGYADIAWPSVSYESGAVTYYLKETDAPAGCEINGTIIPVKVGVYSIYADAGTPDDNVSVSAGVGKLMQTMVQYASEGDVNVTLRDIVAFA